jgi:hypothetical protein
MPLSVMEYHPGLHKQTSTTSKLGQMIIYFTDVVVFRLIQKQEGGRKKRREKKKQTIEEFVRYTFHYHTHTHTYSTYIQNIHNDTNADKKT